MDNIILTCDGVGDVTVALFDIYVWDGYLLDTQVIHQVPEPGTAVLLGVGVLALIRRKR